MSYLVPRPPNYHWHTSTDLPGHSEESIHIAQLTEDVMPVNSRSRPPMAN